MLIMDFTEDPWTILVRCLVPTIRFTGTIPRQSLGLALLVAGPAMLVTALIIESLLLELAGLGTFLGGFILAYREEDEQLSVAITSSLLNSQLFLQSILADPGDKRISFGQVSTSEGPTVLVDRLQGGKVAGQNEVPLPSEDRFGNFYSLIVSKLPLRYENNQQLLTYLGETILEDFHLSTGFDFHLSDGLITINIIGFRLRDVCTDEDKENHSSLGCAFCNTLGMVLAAKMRTGIARLESRYEPSSDSTTISYRAIRSTDQDSVLGGREVRGVA